MNIKKLKSKGSYIRDKFGRYKFEVRLKNGKGEIRRRIWAEDDAEAARQAAIMGKETTLIKLRWSEGMKLWDEAHVKNCSSGYVEDIQLHVRRFIEKIGDIAVEETSYQRMMSYIQEQSQGNNATANRVRRIIWVARWLRKNDFIRNIPFEHIPQFKVKPVPRKPILPSELPKYLEALTDFSRPIIKMLAFTGLRAGALCNLKEPDIKNGAFTVHEKWGKTRVITIDDTLAEILAEARAVKAKKGSCSQYVFINFRGSKWNHNSLWTHCSRNWKKAGLEHRQIHSLRHGFATTAALSGFSPRQLQAALDHEKFSTTERYLHDLQKTVIGDEVGQAVRSELLRHMDNPPDKQALNVKSDFA